MTAKNRIYAYLVIFLILISASFFLFLIPNSSDSAEIFSFSGFFDYMVEKSQPLKKQVLSQNSSTCDEAMGKVRRLSESEKISLNRDLASLVRENPEVLIHRLPAEKKVAGSPATVIFNGCLLQAAAEIGIHGADLFSEMSKAKLSLDATIMNQMKSRIFDLLKFSPNSQVYAAKILSLDAASLEYKELIEYLPRLSFEVMSQALQIYDQKEVTLDHFKDYFPNSLTNSPEAPKELVSYLTDKQKSSPKRLALLKQIIETNRSDKLPLKAIIAFKDETSPEVKALLDRAYASLKIKNQEQLNDFFEFHQKSLLDFSLKTKEDFEKFDSVVNILKQLKTKTVVVTGETQKLDYKFFQKPFTDILNQTALQLGYQSTNFARLTEALADSPLAFDFSGYYETLLNGQAERLVAIGYLKHLPKFSESAAKKIADLLLTLPNSEKLELLDLLLPARTAYNTYAIRPVSIPTVILESCADLLGSSEEKISTKSYDLLLTEKESVIPLVRSKLKNKKIEAKNKIQLLRLLWKYASQKEVMDELQSELKSYKACDGVYSKAFVETIQRQADTLKPPTAQGSGVAASKRSIYPPNDFPDQPSTMKIVSAPDLANFTKYLTCELKNLDFYVLKALAEFDDKFKKEISLQAEVLKGDRKKFFESVLKSMPKRSEKDDESDDETVDHSI